MKRILRLLLLVALAIPAAAPAGTSADPEITDPVGDAVALRTAGATDPSLDITGVWFEPIRSGAALTGIAVTVETAGAAVPASTMLVDWAVQGTDCRASLWMYGHSDPISDPVVGVTVETGSEESMLDYYCDSEEGTVAVLDLLRVRLLGRSVPAGLTIDGNRWTTLVPLAAFSEGPSTGVMTEGAILENLSAVSFEQTVNAGTQVDAAPFCGTVVTWGPCEGTARAYTLGS